jgi:hypothetical protein
MRPGAPAVLLAVCLSLAGCEQPLSGTYVDTEDPARTYTFSGWTKSWSGYYEKAEGTYQVNGSKLRLNNGLEGEIVSPQEFHLDDLPSTAIRPDRPVSVYRRKAD